MAIPRITIPANPSMSFYQDGYAGAQIMGQVPFYNPKDPSGIGTQQQGWQYYNPYYLKFLSTDSITVLVHTQSNASGSVVNKPQLCICDKNKVEISGVLAIMDIAPYNKGTQQIAGNMFYDAYSRTSFQMDASCWSFRFVDFITQIPQWGVFYLRLRNYDATGAIETLWSEPLFISNYLPNTLQFACNYNSNTAKKGIVNSGWFSDMPTDHFAYTPVFMARVEGFINPYEPESIVVDFEGQNYQTIPIKSQTVSKFTLAIGELSIGIPQYMLRLITEMVTADIFYIDNVLYNLATKNATDLTKIWKARNSAGTGLLMASTELQFVNEGQYANMTPWGAIPDRYHSGGFSPDFS